MNDWSIFVIVLFLFGILVSLFYKKLKIEKLNLVIKLISGISCLVLLYYAFFNLYFLIPLIILAACLLFKKHFSSVSFFSNFGGVIALLYVIIEATKVNYILFFVTLALFFNSILSVFSLAIESQQEVEKAKKTKKKEFELRPPTYYYFIIGLLLLVPVVGIIMTILQGAYSLAILLALIFVIFSLTPFVIHVFKIEEKRIVITNLFKRKSVFDFGNIKNVVLRNTPGMWSVPTNLLELHSKDKVKKFDIRTHYNSKDTAEFIAVLKKSLGKKVVEEK